MLFDRVSSAQGKSMSCPSCNKVLGFKEARKNTRKDSGLTKCPGCGACYKVNSKRNIILLSAGALAFFGGPINSWLLGENEILFGVTYTLAVGLFVWFYATPKATLVKDI
jgi:NAD-dependent SIR2 family protein deacetylase